VPLRGQLLRALGGSMLNPVAMAISATSIPTVRSACGPAAIGLALALGPVVGGALASSALGWRWIFVINIPIGLAVALAARWVVPESKADHPRRFDPVGQVLVAAMLACLTYAIIEGPRPGWSAPVIIAAFAVCAVSLAGIIWYEPRRSRGRRCDHRCRAHRPRPATRRGHPHRLVADRRLRPDHPDPRHPQHHGHGQGHRRARTASDAARNSSTGSQQLIGVAVE
jgi:hypothetical protein